jgi:hypothetical protein
MSAIATKPVRIVTPLNKRRNSRKLLPQDTNRLDAFPRRPATVAQKRIFSAPVEAGRRLRIVYILPFSFELSLLVFSLWIQGNIFSAVQLHEQTHMQ